MVSLCPDKETLILENRGLVGCVLKRLSIPPHEWEEFSAIGDLGLVTAAQLFDPERGTKFSTYAYVGIKNRVLSELRRRAREKGSLDWIPDRPAKSFNGHQLDRKRADLEGLLSLLGKKNRLLAERVFGLNGRHSKLPIRSLGKKRRELLVELQWLAQQKRLGDGDT